MSYYQICPVCNGRGEVPTNFYLTPAFSPSVKDVGVTTCRSCQGSGVLLVQENNTQKEISWEIPDVLGDGQCCTCANKYDHVCTSLPPKLQCKLDNSFHDFGDGCKHWKREEPVMYL